MKKAHRIRLNPTPEQEQAFLRAAGIARFAWNWALAEYHRRKEAGEAVDWNAIKKAFRAHIDRDFPFVREVTKCAPEEAIADLRRAINTYYKAKPTVRDLHFPRWRQRRRRIGGFAIANDKLRVDGHEAQLPRIGVVNMAEPLRFGGRITGGRVTERGGRWYLTVVVDVAVSAGTPPPNAVGIDFGLSRFATLSTGEVVETQAHLRRAEARLKRFQRGLSRKQKGSKNQAKWKRRVTRCHERVRCQRNDFLHKFTTDVAERFGALCVEDLNLAGLCRTRLAKSFHDAGIGEALRQLEYKQEWRGGALVRVDRFFPSSRRCHVCGTLYADLALGERVWTCAACGAQHDRDLNAAINLFLEGLSLPAGSGYVGVTPVEPTSATAGFGLPQEVAVKQERTGVAHVCTPER